MEWEVAAKHWYSWIYGSARHERAAFVVVLANNAPSTT
jgi:hypothetical protein